jgi:hypothetical protein
MKNPGRQTVARLMLYPGSYFNRMDEAMDENKFMH